jgi:hypothetical protein
MTDKETLKLALEALKESQTDNDTMEFWDRKTKAITACEKALAAPVQERTNYTENKRSISDCEELAALGWQAITCPSCGNVGARGYPRNTTPPQNHV